MITVRFWGVRGSIATAGPSTAQVGGNTSCVEVRVHGGGADALVVLDAGTGLRALGDALLRDGGPVRATVLLSHLHWDHIQGFPFFAPAYVAGNRIEVVGAAGDGTDLRAALAAQMRAPHFPVGLDAMRATLSFRDMRAGTRLPVDGATVEAAAANHPNGCLAWRIEHDGASLVYATDTEHDGAGRLDENLVRLARGADLLVYDAQYTPDEYRTKRGWGHSTADEGVRLARAAGARRLVLFHHDPSHDDWAVARIEAAARVAFPSTIAAREGLTLVLPGRAGTLDTAA